MSPRPFRQRFRQSGRRRFAWPVLAASTLVAAGPGAQERPAHLLLIEANRAIEDAIRARVRNNAPAARSSLDAAGDAAEILAADHGLPLARSRLQVAAGWTPETAILAVETWEKLDRLEAESVRADPEQATVVLETCREIRDPWCEARALLARAETLAEGSLPRSVRQDTASAEAILREAGPSEELGRALFLQRGAGAGGGDAAAAKALERQEEAIRIAGLVDSPSLEGRALCERVRVHLDRKDFEAARADLDRMREIAASDDAPRVAACGGYREGYLLLVQGNPVGGAERWRGVAESEAVTRAPREALWSLIGVTAMAINAGKGADALRWARRSVEVAGGLHGSDDRGRAYCNLATALVLQGIPADAEQAASTCLDLSRANGVKAGETIGLRGLAIAARSRGETDRALELLRESLAISRENRLPQDTLWNLVFIGNILLDRGDLEDARTHLEEARGIADWLKWPDVRSLTRSSLALVLTHLGEIDEAEQVVDEALNIPSWDGSPVPRPWALRARGFLRTYRQELAAALPDYRQAYEIFGKREQPGYQADVAIDIGNVYYRLFRPGRAFEFYEKAGELAGVAGNAQARLVAAGNVALLKRRSGSMDEAIRAMRDVIGEAKSRGLLSLAHHQSINLADTLEAAGDLEEAEGVTRRALEWAVELQDPEALLHSRRSLASVLSRRGDHGEALQLCETHIRPETAADPSLRMDLLWTCGWVHLRAGDPGGAVGAFRAAIRIAEESSRRVIQRDLLTSFLADRVSIYADLVQALTTGTGSRQRIDEIFQLSESFRARILLQALASVSDDPLETPYGAAAAAGTAGQGRAQLLGSMASLHLAFAAGQVERGRFVDEIRRLEDLLAETSVRRDLPLLVGTVPLTVEKARTALPDASTAALEYLLGSESSFVVVLTRDDAVVVELGSGRVELDDEIQRYRSLLESRSEDLARDMEAIRSFGGRLFRDVVAPALPELDGIRRLIIVPDGGLHVLPFEALVIPDESGPGETHFLIEKFEIAFAPSLGVLKVLGSSRPDRHTRLSLAAVANPDSPSAATEEQDDLLRDALTPTGLPPLPYAEEEVQNAARRLGGDKRTFRGGAATEANARQALQGGYPIVHFATHGFLDPGSIGRSGLVLTPDPPHGDDGLLQVREIIALRVDADLVVLSGCSTGLGRVVGGEGALGLQHALFQAGAPSIVLTLWDVRDRASALFMDRFYAAVADGSTLAEAMRRAKLDLLRSRRPELRHPSVWAPFVLSGVFDRGLGLPPRTLGDRFRTHAAVLGTVLVAIALLGSLILWTVRHRSRSVR